MKGDIRYQLMIDGSPDEELTRNASEILVNESVRDISTCNVKFTVDICKGKYELIDDKRLLPTVNKSISVVAWIDGTQTVLFHGRITERKVDLKHGGSGSTLELSASDRRFELDRNCRNFVSHSGTVSSVVMRILTDHKFSKLDVESFDQLQFNKESTPLNQTVSDLSMLQKLGGTVGAEFWIDWKLEKTRIVETAHFGTQPKRNDQPGGGLGFSLPIDQKTKPTLRLNTGDPDSSLLSFSSVRKSEVPQKSGKVTRVDPRTHQLKTTQVTQPSVKPLGGKPPASEVQCEVLTPGGVEIARAKAEAAYNEASFVIEATGETTAFGICGLVRPRHIVNVDGTGKEDRGEYLVWAVEHKIDPAEHRMKLSMRRNAVGK